METGKSSGVEWKRPLIGCGIGCGALLLLLIIVSVSGYFWFESPGAQVPTQNILGPESLALLRLDHPEEDEGLMALVTDVLLGIQEVDIQRQSREVPFFLQWLTQQQRASAEDALSDLEKDLPREITVTVEDLTGEKEPAVVAAINLARFPKAIRFFLWLSSDENTNRTHGDQEFMTIEGNSVTFVENTLLWSNKDGGIRLALDRLKNPRLESDISTPLIEAYRGTDERWDLYLAIDNRERSLVRILEELKKAKLLEEPLPDLESNVENLEQIWVGGDVVSRDLAEVHLKMECRTPADAERWGTLLRGWIESYGPEPASHLKLEAEVQSEGRRLQVETRWTNIKEAVIQLFLEATQRREVEEEP